MLRTRGEKTVPERGRTEPETGTPVGIECIAEHGRKGNCDGRGRRAGRT